MAIIATAMTRLRTDEDAAVEAYAAAAAVSCAKHEHVYKAHLFEIITRADKVPFANCPWNQPDTPPDPEPDQEMEPVGPGRYDMAAGIPF